MPDRQRHSSLSDVFAGLFAARSQKSPAESGRHLDAVPAASSGTDPDSGQPRDARDGDPDPASGPAGPAGQGGPADPAGPPWEDDPSAVTMVLSRSAWELSARQGRKTDHPDPMADTMQLSRSAVLRPAGQAADPGSGPDTAADADTGSGAGPASPMSVRTLLDRHRRALTICAAGLAAVCVLLALPPVRAQLRDSFTRLPQPYTALYFTTPPQVDGTVLTVPVSVHAVQTTTDAYNVRVWTVDAQGRIDDSRTADLKWDGQALSTVVSMPVNPAAVTVWVSLAGSTETLHYKIAVA
ncbi:hypothetical protein ABIA31_006834 [Catenulispora sp. MAP5-51]|uniref:hypothetical protein n=1 Tax=Catenulispora sp. MAP5-51 TaxID=3156298 RepID=UPI0035199367